MSQERLASLTLLSIEHKRYEPSNYDDIINDFAPQNVKTINFVA